MMHSMHGKIAGGLLLLLVAGPAPALVGDDAPAPPPVKKPAAPVNAKTLEGVLKAAKLEYTASRNNNLTIYKIPIELKGEASVIYAREHTLGKDKSGNEVKLGVLWCLAAPVPGDFKPSANLTRRIAEINNTFVIGNVGLGKAGIFYNSSFWLRTADPGMIIDQFVIAHNTRLMLRKELLPFLQEE